MAIFMRLGAAFAFAVAIFCGISIIVNDLDPDLWIVVLANVALGTTCWALADL